MVSEESLLDIVSIHRMKRKNSGGGLFRSSGIVVDCLSPSISLLISLGAVTFSHMMFPCNQDQYIQTNFI